MASRRAERRLPHRCYYCGVRTRNALACSAHSDLLALDAAAPWRLYGAARRHARRVA